MNKAPSESETFFLKYLSVYTVLFEAIPVSYALDMGRILLEILPLKEFSQGTL